MAKATGPEQEAARALQRLLGAPYVPCLAVVRAVSPLIGSLDLGDLEAIVGNTIGPRMIGIPIDDRSLTRLRDLRWSFSSQGLPVVVRNSKTRQRTRLYVPVVLHGREFYYDLPINVRLHPSGVWSCPVDSLYRSLVNPVRSQDTDEVISLVVRVQGTNVDGLPPGRSGVALVDEEQLDFIHSPNRRRGSSPWEAVPAEETMRVPTALLDAVDVLCDRGDWATPPDDGARRWHRPRVESPKKWFGIDLPDGATLWFAA